MKPLRRTLLAAACCLPITSCATTNLIDWAQDRPSVYHEPEDQFSRAMLKPLVTVVGVPVAVVWDVGTFPFQILFGVPPYGDRLMTEEDDI